MRYQSSSIIAGHDAKYDKRTTRTKNKNKSKKEENYNHNSDNNNNNNDNNDNNNTDIIKFTKKTRIKRQVRIWRSFSSFCEEFMTQEVP